jgi:hypothetical protein
MKRFALLTASIVTLPACGFEGASEVPLLLVPEDVDVHWDASFNASEDGLVALVPVDVMIYDRDTGEPLAFEDLSISTASGAGIVAPDDVLPVGPEAAGDVPWVWDAWRDRYFEITPAEEPPPSSVRVRTDASGLARFYVLADAFPPAEEGFAPLPVVVSMGLVDDTFLLVPR